MTTALGGMISSATILGLGSLLPVQSSLLASTSLMGLRLHPDKVRKSSAPLPIAINVIAADAGAAEACAMVSGMAASPPRTVSSLLGTRRVLAPSYCLSKTRRRRRPSNGGDGRDADDDLGGGGDDGSGNNWGGSGGDYDGWDEDERRGGTMLDALCLWQALCLFSVLQVLHYIATTARPRDEARVSALASLTHSLYNGRRDLAAAAM